MELDRSGRLQRRRSLEKADRILGGYFAAIPQRAGRSRPQNGRAHMEVAGRQLDFRVSIMPSVHGEDAVIRILDKESMSQEFRQLSLDICGFEA